MDLYIYINGVLNNITTGSALNTLTNTSAIIRWGRSVAGTNPLTNGSLSLVGVDLTYSASNQVLTTYDDEKGLFKKYSYYTQTGVEYSFDYNWSSMNRETKTIKSGNTALDGTVESIVDRDDDEWFITTGIIHRTDPTANLRLSLYREFVFATRGSTIFTYDPYGTTAVPDEPISVIRTGKKVVESRLKFTPIYII